MKVNDPGFEAIYQQIIGDPMNVEMLNKGYAPVYRASAQAKIVIVGQAPGRKAQDGGVPWGDVSGVTLRKWLGVSDEQFYDPSLFALIPMDFYYPGKGAHGDLPPRKGFAAKWHPRLLALMPEVELIILIGNYAQRYYLGNRMKENLTQTIHARDEYLPIYFPLVHPSPLNFRWRAINPWFEMEVVPELQAIIKRILG